ncbi:MAG: hypothetical protein ABEJ79_01195 [Halolamina sp.]
MTVRGQAHTLEGFAAALVVLSGVVFALQATAVTPLTASTSNQFIGNQQTDVAEDLLASAEANETLRPTLLYWNASREAFADSPREGYFSNGGPPTAFGTALNETFDGANVAFNVRVEARAPGGGTDSVRLVYMGTPSDNAATATRTVTVFDDARVAGGPDDVSTVAANGNFYARDVDPDGPLFNVMEVHVTVWRI